MKWTALCLFLCVCGVAAMSRAQEPAMALGDDYGNNLSYVNNGDPWNNTVTAPGLRFSEPQVGILLGCGPGYCGGACRNCTHWATRPWYAHWGPGGFGNGMGHCHRRACAAPGCDDCGCQ